MKRWDSPIIDTLVLLAMLTFIVVSGWLRWTRYSRNHSAAQQELEWKAVLPPQSTNDITITVTNTGSFHLDVSAPWPTNQNYIASVPLDELTDTNSVRIVKDIKTGALWKYEGGQWGKYEKSMQIYKP